MTDIGEETIIDVIRSSYGNLSKTQKRIADIILNQGYAAAFMSITELAVLAETTNVTIVSLARNLGLSGWAEFKKHLQDYYTFKISPHYKSNKTFPERTDEILNGDVHTLLSKAFESEIQLLTDTFNTLIDEDLLQASDYLLEARTVFIVAGGVVKPVAGILEQRLSALKKQVVTVPIDNYSLLPAILERADERDVFIIYSFPHYRMIIGGVAQCARIRCSKVICITDSNSSPPAAYSDVVLLCRSASVVFYNSMTAATSLSHILATLLAAQLTPHRKHDEEVLNVLSKFTASAPYYSDIKKLE